MAEDQEHGALVPFCDVFQEEIPLDPISRTCRYRTASFVPYRKSKDTSPNERKALGIHLVDLR